MSCEDRNEDREDYGTDDPVLEGTCRGSQGDTDGNSQVHNPSDELDSVGVSNCGATQSSPTHRLIECDWASGGAVR